MGAARRRKGEKMKLTGYVIENKNDRLNAFSDEPGQHFKSLGEARSWAEAFWEGVLETSEEDEGPQKSDYIVAYYLDGVQRGEYPLFTKN